MGIIVYLLNWHLALCIEHTPVQWLWRSPRRNCIYLGRYICTYSTGINVMLNSISIDLLLISLLGAISTYLLAKRNRFDAIRASSCLSILAYGIFHLIDLNTELYSLVFFGSTFVGMSAPVRFGIESICLSAVLFALFFEYLIPHLTGFGGALGISAFLSVCLSHIAFLLLAKIKSFAP